MKTESTNELEKRIIEFECFVTQHFEFLVNDFGLIKGQLRKQDFDDKREAMVSIRYKGGPVDVEIGWGIGFASIGITLRDNNYPESQQVIAKIKNLKPAKVIYFESAVEYLSEGKEVSLIPEISRNISFSEMKNNADKREKLINQSMEEIVKKLAEKLNKYGAEIIKGDTSRFPEFEKYYAEKYY
jgi:hypothetical protein